jgi:DNA-directed RNA polymerase subunit RPC12/RpoP
MVVGIAWICPKCEHENKQYPENWSCLEDDEEATCDECGRRFMFHLIQVDDEKEGEK